MSWYLPRIPPCYVSVTHSMGSLRTLGFIKAVESDKNSKLVALVKEAGYTTGKDWILGRIDRSVDKAIARASTTIDQSIWLNWRPGLYAHSPTDCACPVPTALTIDKSASVPHWWGPPSHWCTCSAAARCWSSCGA